MKLHPAFLATAAVVEDGLLRVEGGGIDRVVLDRYPAPLPVFLVAVIQGEAEDRGSHAFAIDVLSHRGRVGGVSAHLAVQAMAVDECATFPIAIPLHAITIVEPGDYEADLGIDGTLLARLPLRMD